MRADPEVSIVLVSYNMLPQLRRTLVSLSPGYQIACPEGRCQIILIDNGSAVPPSPADLAVPGLQLEFHHWPDAPPSPVAAVNFGISRARAPHIAVMIDAARMASPGLIDAGMAACKLHPRPVVATYNYHLGSRPQQQTVREGYDEAAEARLLRSIGWPADGYRLFDIAVLTPVFRDGRLVGLVGTVGHVSDIGGTKDSLHAREIYEEGIQIPPMKLFRAGVANEDLFTLLAENVRNPAQVLGDVHSFIAANAVGAERLTAFMSEYGIHDLFVGVPVKLGAKGVEEIIEVPLTAEEKAALHKSAGAVKELVDVIKV